MLPAVQDLYIYIYREGEPSNSTYTTRTHNGYTLYTNTHTHMSNSITNRIIKTMGQTHTHARTGTGTGIHTHTVIIYMCVGITSEKSKCTRDPNPFLWLLIKLRICQWIGIQPRQFIMMHIVSCCQFTEKLFRIKPIKVNVTTKK